MIAAAGYLRLLSLACVSTSGAHAPGTDIVSPLLPTHFLAAAASDTLLDLLAELRSVTEVPVLVAVDSINSLYETSVYPEEGSGELLPGHRLSVPAAFQCFGEEGFK